MLDAQAVPVGKPSWLNEDPSFSDTYWLVTVQLDQLTPGPTPAASRAASGSLTSAFGGISLLTSNSSSRFSDDSSGGRHIQTPFPGLKLGLLLGKGSYGRVYRGKLDGMRVAVKVWASRPPPSHLTVHSSCVV